jgi:chromosome segregation ATPase
MGKQTAKKVDIGTEERLAKRDEAHSMLADLRGTIADAFKVHKEKQQALDAADKALELFCREGGIEQKRRCLRVDASSRIDLSFTFSTDHLETQEKERFEQLKTKVEIAAKEAGEAEARLEELQEEEKAIIAEVFDLDTAVEETILFRTRLSDAAQKVTQLQEQIALQEEVSDKTRSGLPSLDKLNRKREDLLAEIATGNATECQLSELDTLIESEKKRVSVALEDAETTIEHARQTIAGLNRKLTEAEDDLATLELRDKAVISRFLRVEAEKAGSDYARLAGELVGKFRRLVALGRIMSARGFTSIGEDNLHQFTIPRFMLNAHDLPGVEGWYFDGGPVLQHLQRRGINENDMAAETERIARMGITI